MVPYSWLSITMISGVAPYWAAVASSWPFMRNSPSPAMVTTRRSGLASEAAMAEGTEYPMEPFRALIIEA